MFNNQSLHHQQLALVIVRADRRVWSLEASRINNEYLDIYVFRETIQSTETAFVLCSAA